VVRQREGYYREPHRKKRLFIRLFRMNSHSYSRSQEFQFILGISLLLDRFRVEGPLVY
jgi:hypothetical protein